MAMTCQCGDGQHSLSDLDEAAGRCSVQRSPALVVPSVDVTPALHQKLHHLSVFINAGLPGDTQPHDGLLHKCLLFVVYYENPRDTLKKQKPDCTRQSGSGVRTVEKVFDPLQVGLL